ncbi:MAG: glycerophosphodiester phosphodiesterase [Hyphomicrobiales bacterium]|nr:glycerophosphodiester phosphodiesterase [Hyphomicrobiales bacterium]MCP5372511.1 glycerophosphodiester phosphodiesterase [Hyphomicrobiales bacterium]
MRLAALLLAALLGAAPAAAGPGPVDLIAHRGARGELPENTLPAFAHALGVGVTALELDVGMTRDGVVVVSHDRRPSPYLARGRDGRWLTEGEAKPLIQWDFADLRRLDVGRIDPGSGYAGRQPHQKPVDGTPMPTLAEVVELARKAGNGTVRFDVEIKRDPDHPAETRDPEPFARAVLDVLRQGGVLDRTVIQSFDWSVLAAVAKLAPQVRRSYLTAQFRGLNNIQKGRPGTSAWTAGLDIDDFGGSVPRLVAAAGGKIWSVHHRKLDAAALQEAHGLGLTVLVWTVNDPADMGRLLDLGVDGIITDHPARLRKLLAERGYPLPPATPVP